MGKQQFESHQESSVGEFHVFCSAIHDATANVQARGFCACNVRTLSNWACVCVTDSWDDTTLLGEIGFRTHAARSRTSLRMRIVSASAALPRRGFPSVETVSRLSHCLPSRQLIRAEAGSLEGTGDTSRNQ